MAMNAACSLGMIRTVFLITDQIPSFRSTLIAFSCVVAVVVLLFVALLKLRGRRLRIAAAIVLPILLMVCSAWFVPGLGHWFEFSVRAEDYRKALAQYCSGNYKVAEGVASEGQYTHDGGFCFVAGSTRLCTGPYFKEVGYHRNGTSPFILEDGMRVRVYYLDQTILRIDQLD